MTKCFRQVLKARTQAEILSILRVNDVYQNRFRRAWLFDDITNKNQTKLTKQTDFEKCLKAIFEIVVISKFKLLPFNLQIACFS